MREIWRTIKKNVHASLSDLDKTCVRTNRELVYGAVACAAVGVLVGLLLSPKKAVTIGSHNGNNNTGNSAGLTTSDEPEEASPDRETEE